MAAVAYAGRWVLLGSRPPVAAGAVTVDAGRVVAVGRPGPGVAVVDLGDVAILPGFVNAHTHLDLTGAWGLMPPTPGGTFPDWLRQVIAFRRTRSAEQTQADIAAGLAESLRFGTTTVGDISADGTSFDAVARSPLRGVVYRELLGLKSDRADGVLAAAEGWLATTPATSRCRPGLSPHAPYSVGRELFRGAVALAERSGVGVQVHVAESAAEGELLTHQTGSFVPFLEAAGVWQPDALAPGFAWVTDTLAAAPRAVLAHANFLDPATPLGPGLTVCYCPRTHAAFGHPRHPVAELLAAGVRVCLGTDSLASNPDLDILAEARFLFARRPDLTGPTLLAMLTQHGADALGFGAETGSLTPGKWADLVAVAVPPNESDPFSAVFGPGAPDATPRRVMVGGEWVAP